MPAEAHAAALWKCRVTSCLKMTSEAADHGTAHDRTLQDGLDGAKGSLSSIAERSHMCTLGKRLSEDNEHA